MRVKLAGLAIVSSIVLATSACGDDSPKGVEGSEVVDTLVSQGIDQETAEAMGDLYEKALDGEETINFYGLAALPLEPAFETFETAFPGLKVEGTQLNTPDTISRVQAEASSGRVSAGVVSGAPEALAPLDAADNLAEFTPLVADSMVDLAKDPAGYYAPALTPWGPVVPSSMPEAERPTTWKDLSSGNVDGSIASVDASVVGLTTATLTYMLDADIITPDDVKSLAESDFTGYADSGAALNAVASGEKDVMLAHSYSVFAAQKDAGGLDVDFVFPLQDANITTPILLSLPKGAPNEAASELLMNYLYTEPAQDVVVAQGYLPTLEGVDPGDLFPGVADIANPLSGPRMADLADTYGAWAPVIADAFK